MLKDKLEQYKDKFVVINGIEADRVKDKKAGTFQGGTTITFIGEDYVEYRVHNVKAEAKTDNLTETEELIIIPFNTITTVSAGAKDVSKTTPAQATL